MNLTNQQREAIETEKKNVRVVASAGSGKTMILMERAKRLLSQGLSPQDLLILTFTRRAAGEMIDRLRQSLSEDIVNRIMVGTFHSVCLAILLTEGEALGYTTESMTVATSVDQDAVLGAAHDFLRVKVPLSKVYRKLEDFYCDGIILPDDKEHHDIKLVINEYHHRLRRANAVDYGQILALTLELFRCHPDIHARYVARFKHILVDEVQDCNAIQWMVLDTLTPPASLFCVGDWRQSLYGWRGARPDMMVKYPCGPGATTILNLSTNFRSGRSIVEASDELINHDTEPLTHIEKTSVGRSEPSRIDIMHGRTASFVDLIAMLNADGIQHGDIAILSRTNRRLRRIEQELSEAGIPCHLAGSSCSITEAPAFRAIHAAMRIAVNPADSIARDYLTQNHPAGVDILGITKISQEAPAWTTIGDFASLFNANLAEHGVLDSITTFWRDLASEHEISHALLVFALLDSQDDLCGDDSVTLSTVHCAKGLQWPCVVMAETNEGDWPTGRADNLNEERRIAYVAMTRAADRLVIHYRSPDDQSQNKPIRKISRFVREMNIQVLS